MVSLQQVFDSKIFTQMDPLELKNVWKATKKLQKSGIPPKAIISQYARLPSKKGEPKASSSSLSLASSVEGSRLVEDLVQSLLLPLIFQ